MSTQAMLNAPPTAAELKRAVGDLLGESADLIADDQNLALLGVGSLEVMRLATGWKRAGLRVDFAALIEEPTVRAWAQQLHGAWIAQRGDSEDTR